ncbi:DUF192 domain-containing protein [Telmatobacter sp. DSM 110680]|uniref:DUF192 domain-containing protein n=1 Tax=Telmatobacter sp. DSM 110680 TaxID=3036704 RepID=A0AAU7DIQ9_9BACT
MNQSQETKSAGDDKSKRNDCNIRKTVRNQKRDTKLADKLEVAGSGPKRSKGLLGRKNLGPGEGLWIIPCEAVHTFFMQFPIDLVYLDRKYRVKKICAIVPAWRFSACLSAHSVLELPAGTIQDSQTQVGDILEIVDSELVAEPCSL